MSKIQILDFPLIAELNDLKHCIEKMGERPLKLIADGVYKKYNETEWDTPKWSFIEKNGIIEDKKLLPILESTFQFSIANNESKQDLHFHKKTYEIFISNSKIEIFFIKDQKENTININNGLLIVPPGIIHKIKLYGFTYVFQASIENVKIHKDKEIVEL
jgi:hypothetical protein